MHEGRKETRKDGRLDMSAREGAGKKCGIMLLHISEPQRSRVVLLLLDSQEKRKLENKRIARSPEKSRSSMQ